MGELNDALQASLRAFERSGGQFDYTDPLEMVRDLVVLRRAISPVQILAADNPPTLGYTGYWNWYDPGGVMASPPRNLQDLPNSLSEVSVWLQIRLSTLRLWEGGARPDHVEVVRHFFTTAGGRQALLRFINEMATFPVQLDDDERALFRAARPPPSVRDPEPESEPEPEVYIPTRWERILADGDGEL